MAKAKPSADATPDTPTSDAQIKISGVIFTVPTRYSEGSVLTAAEARALNQTLGENLRNNFASVVKKAQEAATTAGTELDAEALRTQFAAYAETYAFSGKRAIRAPLDPVEREATKLAKSAVLEALRKKNYDPKTLPEGKLDAMVADLLSKNSSFKEEAQRRISATQAAAGVALEDLGI